RVRCEETGGDHLVEDAPRRSLGKTRDAGRIAALKLAPDQCLFQQPSGFRLQLLMALDIDAQPAPERTKLEEARHEHDLIEAHAQEPQVKFNQRPLREITTT